MDETIIRSEIQNAVVRAASNEDVIRFRASTDIVDRHRSIVKQDGIDTSAFMQSGAGPFLWGHDSTGGLFGTSDMRNAIGKVVKISKSRFRRPNGKMGRATDIDVEFAKDKESNGPLAASLVRQGVLGNVSIAFIPKKHETKEIDGEEVRVFSETELLEVSLVPVASNPETVAILRSIGPPGQADVDELDELGPEGPWYWSEGRGWSRPLDEIIREFDVRGIVPGNVNTRKAQEDTPWSRPSLADFTDEAWADLTSAQRRRIMGHYAWAPSGDSEEFTFSDLKLPHHRAADGWIVLRGVNAAMGALLGARGGVDIPAADRRKVYNHLAAHIRSFGRVPPPFRSVGDPPPDINGADIGAPEIVSNAVRDWVESQRSA